MPPVEMLIQEAAVYLGISRQAVYSLIRRGYLKARQLRGPRSLWLVDRKSVDKRKAARP